MSSAARTWMAAFIGSTSSLCHKTDFASSVGMTSQIWTKSKIFRKGSPHPPLPVDEAPTGRSQRPTQECRNRQQLKQSKVMKYQGTKLTFSIAVMAMASLSALTDTALAQVGISQLRAPDGSPNP